MIKRKSTIAAKAAAARGKASMNSRGASTSPPPGVSRGSPQSSVKNGMPVYPAVGATPTRVKNPNVEGDENYVPSKVQPVAPKSNIEYLPGPNGEKYPIEISRNRGPVMPSLKMHEPTSEEIAASKAKLAEKQRLNPGAVAPNLGQKEAQMSSAMQQMQKTPMPPSGPGNNQFTGQNPGASQRPMGSPMGMKKGGQVKAYASGGSVRGAGIAQRGVRKCKVY